MSLLCFNCKGVGTTQTIFDLYKLLRRLSPKMVFLSKTKWSKVEMESILTELGNLFRVFVDTRGRVGGLAFLWDKKVDATLLSYSLNHIDCTIHWEGDDKVRRLSGIYGWPETHLKWKMRQLMADLKSHSDLPWLIGRDLNEIFYHGEKSQSTVDSFRETFVNNDLHNLGFSRHECTWCNYRKDGVVIKERLDRFYADTEWTITFSNGE